MSVRSSITADKHWFVGEDRIFEFTVVDAAGAAQNITGWALEWTLRTAVDGTVLLTKTTAPAGGITLTTPLSGVCQVAISDADTYNDGTGAIVIQPGTYVHALRRTDAGYEVVLSYGDAVLQLAASR